jgi:hypothetical protein
MFSLLKLYYVVFNREPSIEFKIGMSRKYIKSFKHLSKRRLSFLVDVHLVESLSEKDRRWMTAESICYVMHEIRSTSDYKLNAISSDSDSVLMLDGSQSSYNEHLEFDSILVEMGA